MALKILSPVETDVGLTLTGLIIAIKDGYRLVPRRTTPKTYEVVAYAYYYVNRDKKPVSEEVLKIIVSESELGNVYGKLYETLKKKYPQSEMV